MILLAVPKFDDPYSIGLVFCDVDDVEVAARQVSQSVSSAKQDLRQVVTLAGV